MKKFFTQLIMFALTAIFMGGTAQAVPIPLRGVVEGFYGTPWDYEKRVDIINFCRKNNLNAYIYAPKDDMYHRDKWRTPYPDEKLNELAELVSTAKKNNVRFIFAISPGLDLKYKGSKGEQDFDAMMKKLESMYQIGVRDFAIFFDDLKDDKGRHNEDGEDQAAFLNRVQKELSARHKDIAPLITVPTEYYYADMIDGKKIKPYTRDFAENLDSKIVVLYSGRGVVCDGIENAEQSAVNKIYGREVGIWWNYPVNDYPLTPDGNRNTKLALGAVEKLPTTNVTAIFFNPMAQEQMSKIALATGAVYANNPADYDSTKAWNKAIENQFGSLAPAMKIFADHSKHMENSWAKVGAPDASEFAAVAYMVIAKADNVNAAEFKLLEQMIDNMDRAANILLEYLPQESLAECKPQLEQFKRLAHADRIALESLKAGSLNPQLKILREEITVNEKQAIISEEAARKFIDDVMNHFEKQNQGKRKKK
ncbi:MAG: beta-N-acetylglucosaminidase domain-containing protein [Selenomonadaceae bacterium]|nr:beta-N-acetylglucosaminidase domain-containing protein [Selenomonadaceae bacterium]